MQGQSSCFMLCGQYQNEIGLNANSIRQEVPLDGQQTQIRENEKDSK